VRTVVVSDLHLGLANDADLLRRPSFLERLTSFVAGADRLVLLGDVLELRDRPLPHVVELARPVFGALGRAIGDGEIVVVAGNHDHHLVEAWLERRLLDSAQPLGLEQFTEPEGALEVLAEAAAPARVRAAYPGLWLADGVYAMHGHFLDRHLTLPTFERLGVAMVERVLGVPPGGDPLSPPGGDDPVTATEYENAQAPIYALLFALAQGTSRPGRGNPAQQSVRVLETLGGRRSAVARLRSWLLGTVAVPGAVGIANRLGLGPVSADLSAGAITRAGVAAMREVARRLRIDARSLIFGHTHRRGPRPTEAEWLLSAGGRMLNTGSWVHSPSLLGPTAEQSDWWPGTVAVIDDGEPSLEHLLDDLGREELRQPD
jgi:predicted phosphodiesterase